MNAMKFAFGFGMPRFSHCNANPFLVRPLAARLLLVICVFQACCACHSGFSSTTTAAAATATTAAINGSSGGTGSVVVYITCPDEKVSDTITHSLVERKLVACVNAIPGVKSTYWWDNKVNTDTEILLIAKTRADLVPDVTTAVKTLHPYKVPEVISVPITDGLPAYLDWIKTSTRP